MRRLILMLMVCAAPLAAQVPINLDTDRCVWQSGDKAAWAIPSLDESDWHPYSAWRANTAQPHLWVRCHADFGSLRAFAQPAIQVTLYSAYELYLNGVRIGAEGDLQNGSSSVNAIHTWPIPAQTPLNGPATIALRITDHTTLLNAGPARNLMNMRLQVSAGEATLLDGLRARIVLARARQQIVAAVYFGFIGVIALMLLGLYVFDRTRKEFLLLSIGCLGLAALRLNEFAIASLASYPVSACLAVVYLGNNALTVTQTPFFYAVARRRIPRAITLTIAIIVIGYIPTLIDVLVGANQPAWLAPFNADYLRPFQLFAHTLISCVPFFAFRPFKSIPRRIRPVAVLCMLWGAADIVWFSVEVTGLPAPGVPDYFARWGLMLLSIRGFVVASVLTAIFALLFRDQRRVTEERALFAGEIHAARDVQQYLIPAHLPAIPGFSIESEYRPAREVGGDFFQVLPQADGSLLIVIGDVAGKGVEAGMLATLIVGSVRTAATFTSDPMRILSLLNERLCGRGLVTCLAIRIDQDGEATLVNAGHLPPYLNGIEMAVEGALPLGAVSGIEFIATHFNLDPDDRLMLMTDGVAEAQNSEGRLFGFERISDLLSTGAGGAALADTAQAFGQEDDITVLTLTFAGAEVLNA